jgi:hypothetical protein
LASDFGKTKVAKSKDSRPTINTELSHYRSLVYAETGEEGGVAINYKLFTRTINYMAKLPASDAK